MLLFFRIYFCFVILFDISAPPFGLFYNFSTFDLNQFPWHIIDSVLSVMFFSSFIRKVIFSWKRFLLPSSSSLKKSKSIRIHIVFYSLFKSLFSTLTKRFFTLFEVYCWLSSCASFSVKAEYSISSWHCIRKVQSYQKELVVFMYAP